MSTGSWMGHSVRTLGPLAFGFLIGALLSLAVFPKMQQQSSGVVDDCLMDAAAPQPLDMIEETADQWQVVVRQAVGGGSASSTAQRRAKVNRPRFYATELGTRDKVYVGVVSSAASIATAGVAINLTTFHHVSRLQFFVEDAESLSPSSSADVASLNLHRFRSDGQSSYMHMIEAIFNQTYHVNYDWFFLTPDSVYIKAFKLYELASHISVGGSMAIGRKKDDGRCDPGAGILLSSRAIETLIQVRKDCAASRVVAEAQSDLEAFELCIHTVANLSCIDEINGKQFKTWRVDGHLRPIGEHIDEVRADDSFNSALTVFPLAGDVDYYALHKHFVDLEIGQMTEWAASIEASLYNVSVETPDGPSWPVGVPPLSRPRSRYEVFKWELFTDSEIFVNEPNQNVRPLVGANRHDVDQVIDFGKRFVAQSESDLEFTRLMNGYRLFDPTRGMNYVLDLVFAKNGARVDRRVHLIRPLTRTEIIHQVPYVKEDVDLTILVPVEAGDGPTAARKFLARYARYCLAAVGEKRVTRVVLAVPSGSPSNSIEQLSRDLSELRARCSSSSNQFDLIIVRPTDSRAPLAAAAADEAVEHYGQDAMYLVLPPYVEVQREFMDRVRINTIRDYQVFFPISFVEYNPKVVGRQTVEPLPAGGGDAKPGGIVVDKNSNFAEKMRQSYSSQIRPLEVHKDVGHFDMNDFSIASFYGADYARLRDKLVKGERAVADLAGIFVGDLHVMRATEPAVRIRYHDKICNPGLTEDDYSRCLVSRREGLASKAQLANLLFKQMPQQEQQPLPA
uniref:Hexosyltransferase n=1 Tax=Plectus sambesii TaxID=2011161 RepID=A0A914VMI8_9BILA